MALLHAVVRAATGQGIAVLALHVHHGLQDAADDWAAHVARTCRRWAQRGAPLTFHLHRLHAAPGRGESVEAWARQGRYRALREMALEQGAAVVLLAHHRGDQAETFLLQALRGGGPAGLAAMPRSALRDGITWARPWLQQPREAIEAYVRRHRIAYIDDTSNADPRFARNRLRAEVMPALTRAFPQAEAALVGAATWAGEAREILAAVAEDDQRHATDGDALMLEAWLALSAARRSNLLRAWLRQRLGRAAPQTLVERLMLELPLARGPARWPCGEGEVRRYRGRIEAVANTFAGSVSAAPLLPIHRAGLYTLAEQGAWLRVTRVARAGVALARLAGAQWRERSGGERFQRASSSALRSLKKQFQAAGLPAWQRTAPLLFDLDGELLFAPGLGLDARAWAGVGEPQVMLEWVRSAGR